MKTLVLFALGAFSAFSQPVTFGVKGGVPFTGFLLVPPDITAMSNTTSYIAGPTLEVRLPANLAVEFDALFRHFGYQATVSFIEFFSRATATSNDWEFPILLKYRLPGEFMRAYIDGGMAWDHLQDLSATLVQSNPGGSTTAHPSGLQNTTTGGVVGAGIDIPVHFLHISPELRYTRWTSKHFTLQNLLSSNQNQVELLLGITF